MRNNLVSKFPNFNSSRRVASGVLLVMKSRINAWEELNSRPFLMFRKRTYITL